MYKKTDLMDWSKEFHAKMPNFEALDIKVDTNATMVRVRHDSTNIEVKVLFDNNVDIFIKRVINAFKRELKNEILYHKITSEVINKILRNLKGE